MTSTVVLLLFIGLLKAEGCPRTHMQRCDNCKAHSTCSPPVSVLIDVDTGDCRQACHDQEDCLMAEYTTNNGSNLASISPEPLSVCRLYNCTEVILDGGFLVFRKSCTSDCLYYELGEVSNWMVTCTSTSLLGQKDLRDKWQCLSMCLDYPGCIGAAFYKQYDECSLHDCYEMISKTDVWLSYKRICKDAPSDTSVVPDKSETLEMSTPKALLVTKPISNEVMTTRAKSESLLFKMESSTAISGDESVSSSSFSTETSLYTERFEIPDKECSLKNKVSISALCTVTFLTCLLTF